jgi:hypothetical protein
MRSASCGRRRFSPSEIRSSLARMMYRTQAQRILAISQPAHAWISGQLLRRLALDLPETVLLAGEQHDMAWLEWERAPSYEAKARRPPSFREVGAAVHAPMWTAAVERALASYGPHVALLISRHGGRIYRRFGLPHAGPRDAEAIRGYLEAQAPREAEWAAGIDSLELERQSDLIAFVDALSLAVCGALSAPAELEFPDPAAPRLRLSAAAPFDLRLAPWPFRGGAFEIEGEGRPVPEGGFADEAAMRGWLASPRRERFVTRLAPG